MPRNKLELANPTFLRALNKVRRERPDVIPYAMQALVALEGLDWNEHRRLSLSHALINPLKVGDDEYSYDIRYDGFLMRLKCEKSQEKGYEYKVTLLLIGPPAYEKDEE